LQFVYHKLINWIIVSEASEAVWLYTLRYHIIIFDIFCWSLSFPRAVPALTFCASFAAPSPKVQKCNRLVWTSRFLSTEQPWPQYIYFKIWGSESTRKSSGWLEAETDWCISCSGTEHYWRRHWSVAQTSSCLHSSHRRTFLIFNVI